MKSAKSFAAFLVIAVVLFANNAISFAQTKCNKIVVSGDDVHRRLLSDTSPLPAGTNWVLLTRENGTGTFRTGPGATPLGNGSFEMSTPGGNDKVTLFNLDHVGTPLSSISAISYSTYRTAGLDKQLPALNIQVDINGDAPGGLTTLVYEPVYNIAATDSVPNNTWQTWDAYNGGQAIWWSSNPINVAPNRDTFVTWDTIVANNPDAVIIGGFGVNQGGGNPGLIGAVDALTIAYGEECVTYDFEAYKKGNCMNGGWKTLQRADGSSFSNQGQCIQYVNTGK